MGEAKRVPLSRIGVPLLVREKPPTRLPWRQAWRKPDGKLAWTFHATEAEAKAARAFA